MMMEEELRKLMSMALDGHADSYHLFLQRASMPLRAYLRRRLNAIPDEVEDLLQETLLAIHAKRHTYRRDELLTPWLYAIARYKMIDFLRRRSQHEALNDPLDEETEWLEASEDAVSDSKKDLGKMLETLPENQRLSIQHTKLDGLSVAEAAAMTGMSVSAIKVGVHRGMKALAKMWKEQA
ncbi:RNA polymerase sigma-70 factor, ECF subfamily [Methylophilus rhizosphaerae]|uniref:RNA polymerase sigma-70 factor, ECF subfamily n=1 Tax=Methylophilus rhizosphaerae TaxID=492660 RepID=A0A1G9BS19_9PROT|nr:sigma-70 family RNA polymerase sigma factor [Methylophilus rhizosphaerae]SDK42236.1 RNA polymerase sigma-70 factor, ECF subfamily [Methylophilus rhizosphaerae]